MNKQQDGFAHAVLIIGLVVAILGALGFIFWQNFIYKAPETKTVTVDSSKTSTKEKVDPYKTWKTYSSKNEGYSLKYPSGWLVINETDSDGPYIRNFDPTSRPNSPKQENTNYPADYINVSVHVDKNDSNFNAEYGMSPAEFYEKLGNVEVKGAAVTYSPDDVSSLKVGSYDAKSAKAEFTETDEVIFILYNDKLYSISLFPYGASSDETVKKILDSLSL